MNCVKIAKEKHWYMSGYSLAPTCNPKTFVITVGNRQICAPSQKNAIPR